MFDIRYHLATLVAVFLALTLGILLGSVIVDKGVLVDQQKALVQSLEARQNDLQDKNQVLSKENNQLKKFQEEALSAINDKLKDKRIAVIVTGDQTDEDQNALRQLLDQAGAKSVVVSTKGLVKKYEDANIRKKLSTFFPETNLSKEELWNKILEKMAVELATPSDAALLLELSNLGLIEIISSENLPAEEVVFFGGTQVSKPTASYIDIPLIQQLDGLDTRAIGVEDTNVKNSYLDAYQEQGISTVDNVDQISGKMAMVYVLLGEDGRFGIRPSAEKIIPSLSPPPEE